MFIYAASFNTSYIGLAMAEVVMILRMSVNEYNDNMFFREIIINTAYIGMELQVKDHIYYYHSINCHRLAVS